MLAVLASLTSHSSCGFAESARRQRRNGKETEVDPLFPIACMVQFQRWPVLWAALVVDDSLEAQPQVYMEAGDHETLIRMSMHSLRI